ncbi:MAG: transglycosylase domain-containing protein [Pseudomonadota bacterium]
MAKDDDSFEQRFPLRRPAEAVEAPRPRPAPRVVRPAVFPTASPPPPPPPPSPTRRLTAAARNWFEPFEPLELTGGMPPPEERWSRAQRGVPPPPPLELVPAMAGGGYTTNLPVVIRPNRWRWVWRGLAVLILLFIAAVAWLALTAPLSKSLQPIAPPSITLLSAEGTPIARRGAVIDAPVDADRLPAHVREAFIAIEDRRFESHWGVDPRGIMRAFVHNVTSDSGSQGGSTITQQLAKNAFLNSDRTATRKFQEVLIAFWLEAWLTKNEILSRYLSNVYFGDNVYGLRAAARHYFSCAPEDLSVSQATLLAGLVQAPSRLAPTGNLKGARDRQRLVIASMVSAGLLDKREAAAVRPAVLKPDRVTQLPNGTYFADWVLPQARDRSGEIATEQEVRTTLEMPIQRAAERAARNAGLRKSQIAIVAMHPDGRVIAMVGGASYGASPFNRATQARRQPGSAFKLFVYLAALRAGMTPDSMVDDSPVSFGGWSPENSHADYAGPITLRQAFAKSSNVVAARLIQRLGVANVTRAARDLGISTPIGDNASIALGSSTVSLLELTAAYAAIAQGSYPVRPQGLDTRDAPRDWWSPGAPTSFPARTREDMRSLLASVVQSGTGRGANLPVPTFGKTGTTQDNRDALFIGYAGDIVAGVWMGNDDNSPNPGLSGSGLPARVWRDFMMKALNLRAAPPPVAVDAGGESDNGIIGLDDVLDGLGIDIGPGEIRTEVDRPDQPDDDRPPPGDPRRREDVVVPTRPGFEGRPGRAPTDRPRGDEGNRGN